MILDWFLGSIGAIIGGSVGIRRDERRALRMQDRSLLQCALRDVSERQPQLSQKWWHGVAEVAPGLLNVDGIGIGVAHVRLESVREPSAREAWSVNPRMVIVRLENDFGPFEMALYQFNLEWLSRALADSADAPGGTADPRNKPRGVED